MRTSTFVHLAASALVIVAISGGTGCSKKGSRGAGSPSAVDFSVSDGTTEATLTSSAADPSESSSAAPAAQLAHSGSKQGLRPDSASNSASDLASDSARVDKQLSVSDGSPVGLAPVAPAVGLAPAVTSVEAPKPAAPPEPECFRASFRHAKMASHSNDEICSQHQNLLTLKHKNVNAESLCVRVNGRPVRFERVKGHPEQVIIGAIAGPKAEITASYCIGKVRCQEDCKIPKDEFLDAIGGTEELGQQLGKWVDSDRDSGDTVAAQLDAQLKKELADLEDKGALFSGWSGDSQARECGTDRKVASSKR